MPKIKVGLGYDVFVDTDSLKKLGEVIKQESLSDKAVIITDPLVNSLHGATLRSGLRDAGIKFETIEIPRGEKSKSLRTVARIYDQLVKLKMHRDSLIIAFGGGVIGDLAGFVAATYMRGIDYIQVPTTLLAQVDASIGGKTGVNHPKGKNLIGSFYQPKMVYIDIKTLSSLPEKELRTGLAEVVKYGVIHDRDFFKFLEENSKHLNTKPFEDKDLLRAALKLWQTIVCESAKIKAWVVNEDETEKGLRMILNFGHTFGHPLETLTGYKTYTHGEAVAIGMVVATTLANRIRMIDKGMVERIISLLKNLGLPTMIENNLSAKRIFNVINIDKKVRRDKIHYVLPERIGKVVIRDDINPVTVRKILKELGAK